MKKLLLLSLLTLLLLTSCMVATQTGEKTRVILDIHGREVAVPEKIDRVACIGSGALRLYSYIGDLDLLCGVESCEYDYLVSVRPYQMANAETFKHLPSIGAGGPSGSPNAEALIAARPDVIFSLYTTDDSAMNDLQEKTGIPVIILDYGDTEAFNETLLSSIRLMGQVLGREERANAVADYLQSLEDDLQNRTAAIPEEDKPSVYLGCQSNYGTHGIGSTSANYSLFNAVSAVNVMDKAGYKGYVRSLDYETLLTLNPDIIILDAGGLANLKEEYASQRDVFDSLSAFSTDQVYLMLPYNAYFTNLEIAYANAYYIGKVLYPGEFADIAPEAKFDEITSFLLGKPLCKDVTTTLGVTYGKLDLTLLEN